MNNYLEESERILSKCLKNKKFMKMDLNKLVFNIDASDTEEEETEEPQRHFYYKRVNGYMKQIYFDLPRTNESTIKCT